MSEINNTVKEILDRLSISKTSQFIGITYTSTSGRILPETAKYVINTNVNLNRVYSEDIETVESFKNEQTDEMTIEVCDEIINSLKKSLDCGIGNNPNYTRKDTTEKVNGTLRKVYFKDGSFRGYEILGLVRSRTVIVEGEYKKVNSRPKTILKNKIKKSLNLGTSKIVSLTVSLEKINGIRHNGDSIELCEEFVVTPKDLLDTLYLRREFTETVHS